MKSKKFNSQCYGKSRGPTGIRNRGLAQSYAEQSKARIIPLDHRAVNSWNFSSTTVYKSCHNIQAASRQRGRPAVGIVERLGFAKKIGAEILEKTLSIVLAVWMTAYQTLFRRKVAWHSCVYLSIEKTLGFASRDHRLWSRVKTRSSPACGLPSVVSPTRFWSLWKCRQPATA
jgi:hypothetical protein